MRKQCLTCGRDIDVSRPEGAEKWKLTNPNGTAHIHPRQEAGRWTGFDFGGSLQGEMALEAFGRSMDEYEIANDMYESGLTYIDLSGEWV